MLRAILEGVVLFLLPYAGFAIYLVVRGQNPLQPDVWSRKALSWLTIAALVVCIIGVVFVGANRTVESGVFVPSHVDQDGRFVPGGFRRP
jgi:hypothetical protein